MDKDAVLENADGIDAALLQKLTDMGYAYSPDTVDEDEIPSAASVPNITNEATTVMEGRSNDEQEDAPTKLTISMPRDFFTEQALDNLRRIIRNMHTLLLHAFGKADTDHLDIAEVDDKIEFPWFTLTEDGDSTAYSQFITLLCQFAKERKRVAVKSSTPDSTENSDFNEKYTFRCFLLRLGMIGAEYKDARKVLLRNLTGSSAFKNSTASSDDAAENGGAV